MLLYDEVMSFGVTREGPKLNNASGPRIYSYATDTSHQYPSHLRRNTRNPLGLPFIWDQNSGRLRVLNREISNRRIADEHKYRYCSP